MNYRIGDKVGGYEVTGVLGAGGMGEIYAVRNVISDRAEAMKVLLSDLRAEADLAERFIREIKLQARLRHANIAGLHTAFEADDQLVMIMELVDGQTLSDLLTRSGLAVGDAVDYTLQALSALDYAHSQGVVHRDIKPSNIMVTAEGAVKLMDFGIAKAMKDKSLTRTGNLIGSLHYMSPEQVRGDPDIDGRTDIYSLGVVVYEMVTGRKPFDGNSEFSIMKAHLEEPPVPPEQVDASIAPDLSEVILIAMAKERSQRYQTAGEFLEALGRFGGNDAAGQSSVSSSHQAPAPSPPKVDPEITGYFRPATAESGERDATPQPDRHDTSASGQVDPQITGYMRPADPALQPKAPAGDSGPRQSAGSRPRLRTISGERAAPPDLPEAPPEPAVRRMFPQVAIGVCIAAALALGFLIPSWLSDGSPESATTTAPETKPIAESAPISPVTADGIGEASPPPSPPVRTPARSARPATPPSRPSPSNQPPSRPGVRKRITEPVTSSPQPASPALPPPSTTARTPPSDPPATTPPVAPKKAAVTTSPAAQPPASPAAPAASGAQPDPPTRPATPPPSASPSAPLKRAAPDQERVYTIKEPGVSPPQMVHQEQPQYPEEARAQRLQGSVILEAEVWQDGVAHNIRVLQSLSGALDQSAIAALRKWRFAPGVKDGQAVKVKIAVQLQFKLM
jgi:serine/threonine-protein kinase